VIRRVRLFVRDAGCSLIFMQFDTDVEHHSSDNET